MTLPNQPQRRPASTPDLILDEQPERRAVHHTGVDGVPLAPLKRTATMPNMAALKAPPLFSQPEPVLPVPPPLPREHAATVPAAAHQARTQRAPSPLEVQAIRIEEQSEPPQGASLPPPSSDPNEAIQRAQRRALDSKDTQLERERRERLKAELQLEITLDRIAKSAPPSKPWIDERLVKALVGLLGALATLGAPLGIWLTAKATAADSAQERQAKTTEQASTTASSAKAESSSANKDLDELRKQLAAERAYNREVMRRMGVEVPKRPGDPDPPQLDVDVPLRKPGTVTPGPVLIVKTPPP